MKSTCAMCGQRFDEQRDTRRWKAHTTPVAGVGGELRATGKPKAAVVCTDCFLDLVEDEYGA